MAAYPRVRVAAGRIGAAQVNAGEVIVKPSADRTLTVVDAWMRAIGGNAAGATSVDVEDTASSPQVAVAFAVAALTANTVARAGVSNTTATNLRLPLNKGEGLQIVKNGSDLTTATAIDYCVFYTVSA